MVLETRIGTHPDMQSEIVTEQHPAERTFQTAHGLEILEDARNALKSRGLDATISVSMIPAVDAIRSFDIPNMPHQPRQDGWKQVVRGVISYTEHGVSHERGIEAFEDNTLRVVTKDSSGWVSLKEAHANGSLGTVVYTRIGDAVVRILDGDWQEGRVAQTQLGRQLEGILPVSLPDYANIYLPTKTVKK